MARQYGNGTEAAENAARIVAEEKEATKSTVKKIVKYISIGIIILGVISLISNIKEMGDLASQGDEYNDKATEAQAELDEINANLDTLIEYKNVYFTLGNPSEAGKRVAELQKQIQTARYNGQNTMVASLYDEVSHYIPKGSGSWSIDDTGTWYFDLSYWFESSKVGDADRIIPYVVWTYYEDTDTKRQYPIAFAIGRYIASSNTFDSIKIYQTDNWTMLKQYDLSKHPVDKNGDGQITKDETFYGVETDDYANYEDALEEEWRKKQQAEASSVNDECGDCE